MTRSAIATIGTAQKTNVARQLSPSKGKSRGKSATGRISPTSNPFV